MFKAMVMLCFLNAPPDSCVVFEDTTGLKESRVQCYICLLYTSTLPTNREV